MPWAGRARHGSSLDRRGRRPRDRATRPVSGRARPEGGASSTAGQPGVTVEPIEQVDHDHTFCPELFVDVVRPPDALVGEIDDGWKVATALLAHEREGVGGASPYVGGRNLLAPRSTAAVNTAAMLARALGMEHDPDVRHLGCDE